MSGRDVRVLRAVAWVALAVGVAIAVALLVQARQVTTTIETLGGHARARYEGVTITVRGIYLIGGGAALVGGLVLWSLLRVVAGIAVDLRALRAGRQE
jgi:hypothetical protein